MKQKIHVLLLVLTAFLWGTTFVAQSIGSDYVDAYTYLASRSWIAVVFLTPVIHVLDGVYDRRGLDNRRPKDPADRKLLLIGGLLSGILLFSASLAQQIGVSYTTTAKAGFITALYVVIVPVFSIFRKKKPQPRIWVCVVISLIGMYLLCMTSERFSLQIGDVYVIVCAFLFALQIMIVDSYSPRTDGVRLSRIQFLVVAVLSTVLMLIHGVPAGEAFRQALPAILYAGILSSGVAYTLQIVAQEDVSPTVASLAMSLESVFSALAGWIVLGQTLSGRELFGCILMFAAILLAQIDWKPGRKSAG